MADLLKIKEVSSRYDVTARTLRYYEVLGSFDIWFCEYDKMRKGISFSPLDFMFFEEDGRGMWLYAVEDWVTEKDTNGYEIIEFEGGLYANAVSMDGDDDISGRVYMGIKQWI